MPDRRRVLVCAPSFPEFDRESGSRRIYDCVIELRRQGWSVTYVAREGAGGDRYRDALRRQGIGCYVGLDAITDAFLAGARFDLAVIAFWELAEALLPRLRRVTPSTRVVVDSIDVHFLRRARQVLGAVARGERTTMLDGWFGDEVARELNTYAAADGVMTVSPKEAALVDDLVSAHGLALCVPDIEEVVADPRPFHGRAGMLFTGNFRHGPNAEAVEWLCRDIVPRVERSQLSDHPLLVVGNSPGERVVRLGALSSDVRVVGWVPSVEPYLAHARVAVVPLLSGAGTKRKLIQAMAAGLPAVSTSVGVEGLDVRHGRDVLVADDAADFALAVSTLLEDEDLWAQLSAGGRAYVAERHARRRVSGLLAGAVEAALVRPPKPPAMADELRGDQPSTRYAALLHRLGRVLRHRLPTAATVLMVSKGDDDLVTLEGVRATHFPGDGAGGYLGWHPPDSGDAISRLEAARSAGADYLVVPEPSLWWLDHYGGLRRHLEKRYRLAFAEADTCAVYDLAERVEASEPPRPPSSSEALRPAPLARPTIRGVDRVAPPVGERVLVVGVYLAGNDSNAEDVAAVLAEAEAVEVTQRWIALGAARASGDLGTFTVDAVKDRCPKYDLLNRLLAGEDLASFDFVVMADDDIVLPHGFLDVFIGLQRGLEFALAQPARTLNSFIDHPIVGQQPGVVARETRFVEIGPLVSVAQPAFDVVFPFDLTSPMGWGYENVWSYELERRKLKMGIIDAVPVDHSLRPPVANYDWQEAADQRQAYWDRHPHTSLEECMRVVDVVTATAGGQP